MAKMNFNGEPCEVLSERAPSNRGKAIRTVHTLAHFVQAGFRGLNGNVNTCPFNKAVALHSEECMSCRHRLRLKRMPERADYSIECLAFDVREMRHAGDALEYTDPIVVYPN